MISRAHRFHGHNALRHVYGRGQTARSQLVAIKYLANPRRGSYRAAVVVSRKVHKSAVVRGRIRRRIYEILRLQADNMTEPYDIVITVFGEQLAALPAPQLQEAVIVPLQRAGVLSPATTAQEGPAKGAQAAANPGQHAIVDEKERAA